MAASQPTKNAVDTQLGPHPDLLSPLPDGASQDVGYINPRSQSGLRDVGDAARVRMRFTVSTQDRVVAGFLIRRFQMFGMTDGEPRGFDPGSVFSDGRLEYTEGEEWTADGTDAQFYIRTGALP